MAPQGPNVAYPKIVEPCVKGQGLALSGSAKDSKTCLWYERIGILNANQDTVARKSLDHTSLFLDDRKRIKRKKVNTTQG